MQQSQGTDGQGTRRRNTYRLDLQIGKVGAHAAVAAAAKANESELGLLVLAARLEEALVVVLVRVLEEGIHPVLHCR